jgi:hypothetical protein
MNVRIDRQAGTDRGERHRGRAEHADDRPRLTQDT